MKLTTLALASSCLLLGGAEALSWTVRFRSYEKDSCYFVNVADVSDTLSIYYNVHFTSLIN
jgi:hypothetical protein